MADDHRRQLAERVEQPHHVAHQVQERVLADVVGTVGAAITAHVGRDRVVAGLRQRLELVSPGIPGLGKAVAHHDHRSRSLLGDVHLDAVGLDRAVRRWCHCLSWLGS